MVAVVTMRQGTTGRQYRLCSENDYTAVHKAQAQVTQILDEWRRGESDGLSPIPDEPTPPGGGSGAGRAFSVQRYGMLHWGDLFTARQKVALVKLTRAIRDLPKEAHGEVRELLSLVAGRVADKCAALVEWHDSREFVNHVFSRQALAPQWSTAEAPVLAEVGFDGALQWVCRVVEAGISSRIGQVELSDATNHPLPDEAADVWFTDPPYYDAVPYADLSDFFLVWLKRALPNHPLLRDPFDTENPLSPARSAKLCRTRRNKRVGDRKTGTGSKKRWQEPSQRAAACYMATVWAL